MGQVDKLIRQLALKKHPEGGYFKETYRSEGVIEGAELLNIHKDKRNYSTCIYFLLTSGSFSAFHKLHQDEIWHFYQGAPIELHILSEQGEHQIHILGSELDEGQIFQLVVPANCWFAAKVVTPDNYALVGCTVAPGFDFDDFTLGKREELLLDYPEHKELILNFTRK